MDKYKTEDGHEFQIVDHQTEATIIWNGRRFNSGHLDLAVAKGELPASVRDAYIIAMAWDAGYTDGLAGRNHVRNDAAYLAGFSQGEAMYLAQA